MLDCGLYVAVTGWSCPVSKYDESSVHKNVQISGMVVSRSKFTAVVKRVLSRGEPWARLPYWSSSTDKYTQPLHTILDVLDRYLAINIRRLSQNPQYNFSMIPYFQDF